jgi:hypothetical protein
MAKIIESFVPYPGEHCETTAMGNLLQFAGIQLSEPMLLGLGQGFGFIYWDMMKMDFPFIGGRIKPDQLMVTKSSWLGHQYSRDIIDQESVAEYTKLH